MNLEIPADAIPDPEKTIVEEGLPRFVNTPEEATALSCSACGAARLRGAPMCFHCGSGLESEVVFDMDKLKQMADQLDWKEDLGGSEFPNLIDRARSISRERGKAVFVLVQGVPLIVNAKDNLTDKEIYSNFKILKKLKARNELGDLWFKALMRFNELQKRISKIDPGIRQEINNLLNDRPEFSMDGKDYASSFLCSVDFKDAEEAMGIYTGNYADQLNKYINAIEEILNSLKQ